ncbi:MAG: hypothetical protein PHE28_06930 [Bacteroidales bacterium]|nr:hypothetical protein [Bacteroidales bacterium]
MKRRKLYILLLLIFIPQLIFSQSKEELETKLNVICCDEGNIPELEIKYREIARELIKQDSFNIVGYNFLLRSYNARGEKDSIKILTDKYNKKLLEERSKGNEWFSVISFNNPDYIKDYVRYIQSYEKDYKNRRKDKELAIELAEKYYKLFMYQIKRELRNDSIIKCAEKASFYLHEAYIKDENKYSAYIYPYIQLKYFLKEDIDSITNKYKDLEYPYIFPIIGFAEYPKDWIRDYRTNLMRETSSFIFENNSCSKHFKALKEEKLYQKKTDNEIFRFLLRPSFSSPICVRVEKNNNVYLLTVKKTNGNSEYNKKERLVYEREKKITEDQWKELKKMVNNINNWEVFFEDNIWVTLDGESWLFEHLSPDGYKVKDVDNPEDKFKTLGLYLLKLADIDY